MKPAPSVLSKCCSDILWETGYREEEGKKRRSERRALQETPAWVEKEIGSREAINGTHRSDTMVDAVRSDGAIRVGPRLVSVVTSISTQA